jgi:hypothetical protein
MTKNDDFNENFKNKSIYAHKMQTYAEKLIEYMVKCARDKVHDFCYPRFKEFWGISKAFCKARFSRIAEIPIEKVSRGRANELCLVRFCKSLFRRHHKRWLIIGTDNIWYYTDSKKEPIDMADNVMVDRSARLCIAKYTQDEIIIDIWLSRRRILIQLPFYMGLTSEGIQNVKLQPNQ